MVGLAHILAGAFEDGVAGGGDIAGYKGFIGRSRVAVHRQPGEVVKCIFFVCREGDAKRPLFDAERPNLCSVLFEGIPDFGICFRVLLVSSRNAGLSAHYGEGVPFF